ncbi:MAG: tyrosine-type recombinase/integrase [Bacteroidetes bacterium]|nr:tyrosine-type recombinase/integrase [Bacteroidota bacterium]
MTTDSFIRYLKYERRLSDHTVSAYLTDLEQCFQYLADMYEITEAAEIHHFHIRAWIVHLMDGGMKSRSVNRKISSLKSFFRFELQHERIDVDPMQKIISPKGGKKLPVVVQEKQLEQLFTQIPFTDDFAGLRDCLMLEMLYSTGMRRAELMGLKDPDIDVRSNQIRVFGKGGKERRIPLLPPLEGLIKAYRESRAATFEATEFSAFFLTDKGSPLYPNFVYRKVKQYLGLVSTGERQSPHVLRHSFATHLTDHGADLNAVKELLGHASLAATQVYTHNSMEKLRAVYEKAHPKAKKTEQ